MSLFNYIYIFTVHAEPSISVAVPRVPVLLRPAGPATHLLIDDQSVIKRRGLCQISLRESWGYSQESQATLATSAG